MLMSIIPIILMLAFLRFALPFIIINIAGMIIGQKELVTENIHNIFHNDPATQKHSGTSIIERVFVYGLMFCTSICVLLPEISFPYAVAAFILLILQILMSTLNLKNGTSYLWVLRLRFRNKTLSNNSGMYTNNVRGRGIRTINQNNNTINYVSTSNERVAINHNGRRSPDGKIDGWDVWSVNGSKKCYITDRGMLIFKTDVMKSITGKNISDTSEVMFEFANNDRLITEVCDILKIDPVIFISSKGVLSSRLYVSDDGYLYETPFDGNKYPADYVLDTNLVIKEIEAGYYIAESNKNGIIISSIIKENNEYKFFTVDNGKRVLYRLNEKFEVLEPATISNKSIPEDTQSLKAGIIEISESAKQTIDNMKNVVNALPSLSSLKVSVKNLTKTKLSGFGNDGVYNDGTVDVMCEFGELIVLSEETILPTLQSMVLSKLMSTMVMSDVLRRIGNSWVNAKVSELFDDVCITLKDTITTKQNQCLNYWIADNDNVYYMSLVFNGEIATSDEIYNLVYNLGTKVFMRNGLNIDSEIDYKCSIYTADSSKFVEEEIDTQSYFTINPLNTSPALFNKYLTEVKDVGDKFKEASRRAQMAFKVRISGCVSYTNDNGQTGYCCKATMNKSFILDWKRDKAVNMLSVKKSDATPSKLKLTLNKLINNLFSKDFNNIFVLVFERNDDTCEVNFLFSEKEEATTQEIYDSVFNTALIPYACYSKLNDYNLKESSNQNMYITTFIRKKKG